MVREDGLPVFVDAVTAYMYTDAAAWLRFVDDDGGTGVRGALFQTSGNGEPLGFYLTRVELGTPVPAQRRDSRRRAREELVGSLLRSAFPAPVLMLCLAGEAPAEAFTGDGRAGLPVGRIGPAADSTDAGPARGNHQQTFWVGDAPRAGSPARRLVDELMDRDDPLEPLNRAAAALSLAFADERIRTMTSACGLTTVVSLASFTEHPDDYRSESRATGGAAGAIREQHAPTLAEQLRTVLGAPPCSRRSRSIDLPWAGTLMPFQQEVVQALLDTERLLLADDMGLGKTLQVIAALRILRAKRMIASCLVAAPAGLLDQWRRQLEQWAPELSAIIIRGTVSDRAWQWTAEVGVTLVSYDTLRSDFGGGPHAPVRMRQWDVVVADEAQRIKNRNDTSDALKGLRRARSWALTGTPIENHEEELASILEFVDHDGHGAPKRYRPGEKLLSRHRELQLRRKKGDVLDDLPPKQITKVSIDLNSMQRTSYDKAERDGIVYLKSLGSEVTVRHVLELITRLKQICNADPQTGASSKLEDIKDRLERLTAQGHKALVFSQYTNDVSGVAAAASYLRELNPLTLTGDMTLPERTEIIDRFKTDNGHQVLVLSLHAGGLGFNMQEASYVFHLDRWWNPAVERQAEDRSHRIGQTVKVNVISYSCTDTIEQRIDAILERKQDLFDQLIDDVSLDLSAHMNREELFGLFRLAAA